MFLEIDEVLTTAEVARLRQLATDLQFVDGRISNPTNQTKLNQQADLSSPGYAESSNIVAAALMRSREFRDFAFPQRIAPPLLARYRPGMRYGVHADTAFIAGSGQLIRTDVSVTLFLSDPTSFDGGELIVRLGGRGLQFKGQPGSAVLYPSTTLHEVAPVRSGERLVSITFVQSMIADEARRATLYELNEVAALEGLKMNWDNRVRLEAVRNNLLRQWSVE